MQEIVVILAISFTISAQAVASMAAGQDGKYPNANADAIPNLNPKPNHERRDSLNSPWPLCARVPMITSNNVSFLSQSINFSQSNDNGQGS